MFQILLTSDVINSRTILKNNLLKEKLNIFNKIIKDDLLTKAQISRGDEIQFILKFNENFFKNLLYFRATLYPIKIRTACSLTNSNFLNISLNTNSWNLNGTDFFFVRDLLDNVLKKEKNYTIRFSSTFNKYDNLLNSYFVLFDIICNSWKEKQWEVVKLFLTENDNKSISKKLNLYSEKNNKPTQTFYDRINKSNIQQIISSSNDLISFFKTEEVI